MICFALFPAVPMKARPDRASPAMAGKSLRAEGVHMKGGSMDDRMTVSVVIPSYNRRVSLRRTLLSLSRQDYDHSAIEVLVADTGSNDGTADMLAAFMAPFELH